MGPVLGGSVVNDLELGGNFDPIAIGIGDENKQVVAGSMAARAPDQPDVAGREVVSPIAYFGPFPCFVAVMVNARVTRAEEGQRMMFVV